MADLWPGATGHPFRSVRESRSWRRRRFETSCSCESCGAIVEIKAKVDVSWGFLGSSRHRCLSWTSSRRSSMAAILPASSECLCTCSLPAGPIRTHPSGCPCITLTDDFTASGGDFEAFAPCAQTANEQTRAQTMQCAQFEEKEQSMHPACIQGMV